MTRLANHATLARQLNDHSRFLFCYAISLGVHPQNARDLVQQTFVKALGSLSQFHGGNDELQMRMWLIVILRNEHYSECRHRLFVERRAHLIDDDGICDSDAHSVCQVHYLDQQLESLPEHHRTVVAEVLQGYEYHEIAERLGLPIGTVKSRLWRAREALQAEA